MNRMPKFSVAPAFSSHMVLERGTGTRVWGKASKIGLTITVSVGDVTAQAVSDIEKRWEVSLPRIEASTLPVTLSVSDGIDVITFEDVLIGEVYLVTGQSNAEMTFNAEEQTHAYFKTLLEETPRYPLLRALVQHRADNEPASYNQFVTDAFSNPARSLWRRLDCPEVTTEVSIIGYCFARELFRALDETVPVGIVMAASSGSPWQEIAPGELAAAYGYDTNRNDLIAVSGMYNTMIAPVQNMSLSGILFYQGESEMDNPRRRLYGYMMQSYVAELRRRFRAQLPFYFVQLSSHPPFERSHWKHIETIREAQFDILRLVPDSYMAVSRDRGWREGDLNMYHPYRKDTLGKRLADLALAVQFGKANLDKVCSPIPYEAKFSQSKAVVRFRHVSSGLRKSGGRSLVGFELCGKDGEYQPARAKITAPDTVEITGVKNPTAVRFGHLFLAYMEYANLENGAGLPAPCFELLKDTYHLNLQ